MAVTVRTPEVFYALDSYNESEDYVPEVVEVVEPEMQARGFIPRQPIKDKPKALSLGRNLLAKER